MDGTLPKDISGRHLIEGRGVPIDGGVFVSADGARTLVDCSPEMQSKLNKVVNDIVNKMNLAPRLALDTVIGEVQSALPINDSNVAEMKETWNRDEFQLQMFLSNKREGDSQELGGGNSDHQALLAALVLEKFYQGQSRLRKIKQFVSGTSPKVAIIKDPVDKHAIVTFINSHNSVYRFDPKLDSKFVKL